MPYGNVNVQYMLQIDRQSLDYILILYILHAYEQNTYLFQFHYTEKTMAFVTRDINLKKKMCGMYRTLVIPLLIEAILS